MAARNTPVLMRKKPRKAYTISRPREKWSADEHESFVHALLIFGRDWKTIEQFPRPKVLPQGPQARPRRRAAAASPALPPPHPRLGAAIFPRPPSSCFHHDATAAPPQQSVDWASCTISDGACWPADGSFMITTPNGGDDVQVAGASPSNEAWFADCSLLQGDTTPLPLSPDDLRFAEVYAFVGDAFGSDAPRP
ncbi:hypothetical protein EJB05_33454, partial [Eragrostis curvula]